MRIRVSTRAKQKIRAEDDWWRAERRDAPELFAGIAFHQVRALSALGRPREADTPTWLEASRPSSLDSNHRIRRRSVFVTLRPSALTSSLGEIAQEELRLNAVRGGRSASELLSTAFRELERAGLIDSGAILRKLLVRPPRPAQPA